MASPAFAATVSVNEGTSTGTTVYTASDQTAGVTYSLTGTDASAFTINSSGAVKFVSVPDFETKASYNFTINAFLSSTLHSAESVVVNINNLPPVISSGSTASINEGVPANTTVYTTIAADPAGGTVTYSLTGTDASAFSINSSTGVVKINATPDFETKSTYNFTVKASDSSGSFTTQAITLSINNLPPTISSAASASVNSGASAGTTIYTAVAADPAGGAVTYSLSGTDATAFTINGSTGVVTINAVPNYSIQSSYSFTVRASDPAGAFDVKTVTLTVTAVVAGNPSVLTGTAWRSNGVFEFSFTNLAGASFTVLASTNPALPVSNWMVLGVVTDSPAGQYHFSEQATNNPRRFYRVRSP